MKTFLFLAVALSTQAAYSAQAKLRSESLKGFTAQVSITNTQKGAKVVARASGLKPGSVHGFHIHEKGECQGPDFKSAGDHYNPSKDQHAGPASSEKHFGDLGNLIVNDKGIATAEVVIAKADAKLFVGRSIIIHAKADDLSSRRAGDSGDRIACGVIVQ